MINFVYWKWRQRPVFRENYKAEYVNAMVRMMDDALPDLPHRSVCITDDPRGVECPTHPLWDDHRGILNVSGQHLPSCYRRLKIFDRRTQEEIGIPVGERIVSVDVDAVVTRPMSKVFRRDERFVGWVIKGHKRDWVINGSMFMLFAGDLQEIWDSFDPVRSPMKAHNAGFLGSDQGHLSYSLIGKSYAAGWRRGEVLSFTRDVVRGGVPPSSGCITFFAGARKPWHEEVQRSAPWVSKYVTYDTARERSTA